MKKQQEYLKTWLDYRVDLETFLTENIIDNNYSFFYECWEWSIPPNRAVNFYL